MVTKTIFGNLPDDWSTPTIEDVCSNFSMGPFGSDIKTSNFVSRGIPVIRGINLTIPPFYEYGFVFLTEKKADELKSANAFQNDLIFTHRGTLGQVGLIPINSKFKRYIISQSQMKCSCNLQELEPLFVFYFFQSIHGQKMIFEQSTHSGVPHITQPLKTLRKFLIIKPPLSEQGKIAEVLSDTDNLINKLETLIEKKKNIKQGTMQELLTGKRRLPEYNGEWEIKKLKDIAEVIKGRGLSKNKVCSEGKYKCILYGELFTTYSRVIKNIVSKTNYFEGILSKKGDILIPTSTSTIGIDLATSSVLLEDNILLGGDINIIRTKKQYYNSVFLANYITNILKNKIAEIAQGITIIHLYGKNLKELEITIPKNLEEQTAIAEILTDMDNEIEEFEKRKGKYLMLKQGMMQKLLTGEIRLQ